MKKLIVLSFVAILFLVNNKAFSQTKSCCSMNANTEFAMLGNDAAFQKAHLSPEPINFTPSTGVMISFQTPDGAMGSGFMVKSEIKSQKFLLVFHEWWGLNDHIRLEAEKLAAELKDVNIIAVDLYDGKVAATADEAGKLMQSVKQERAMAIAKGAIDYTGPESELQTIGWCFGGGWSLQACMLAGSHAKGCVIYYGMPEKDAAKLKTIQAPVLGIFASKDGWINKPVVDEFAKQMEELKKPLTVKWYDADHAFANPSNPSKYDKAAADDAHALSMDFIKKNFSLK